MSAELLKSPIPPYVSAWLDEYFHKSASESPIRLPSKKTIGFLSRFKKDDVVKLYRGVNKYNASLAPVVSWTYDREIAVRYIKDAGGGKIVEKEFSPQNIMVDMTLLDETQRTMVGYDYAVDDKEVLVLHKKWFE